MKPNESAETKNPQPPVAERRPTSRIVHDTVLSDDYAWIRADNWKDVLRDPALLPADISELIKTENDYAASLLAPTETLQEELLKELRGRIKEDDSQVPVADGPYLYYSRQRQGGEHEIVCRQPRDGGAEQVLLDADALAEGKTFFDLGAAAASPDHRYLAWAADEAGSEFYTVHLRDLTGGNDLADLIPDTEGSVVWGANSDFILYVRLDANHRPNRVFRHKLGTEVADDVLVFEEPDPAWFVHIGRTSSRRFAIIDVSDHDANEARLLDLADPQSKPRLVATRERGIRYQVEHRGEKLFILTNAEAEDFRIVEAPLANPQRDHWTDVIPSNPGTMIVSMLVLQSYLVRLERQEGLPRIIIRELTGGGETTIHFDEEAYTLGIERGGEFDTPILRFTYSSMTTPREVYDYDMRDATQVLRKRQEVPSGHDPRDYVTRRIFATSPDGAKVPVSLLYAKGTPIDGTAPLLLQGYGAYGAATPASFSSARLSLVDRGFVYAIAHIRGGTDKGRRWYLDGKLDKKTNTFIDFISAARELNAAGFAAPARIVALGGSAGGMLMGAVANMAPELFVAIIADVPFVDVLNTMLDAELPLTPPEWLEWGNPIADLSAFKAIRAYSPYDNVAAQRYPAILAEAGLTDPRVTYWEPAKWVARLRATMTGGGPVLLKTNMGAGHGGASGRFERLKEVALEYAFAIAAVENRLGGQQ